MARAKNRGNGRLDESLTAMKQAETNMLQALANLAQNQTALMVRLAQIDADIAATNRINSERFARIEAILADHSRILEALPEAIHRKFGFRPPEPAG